MDASEHKYISLRLLSILKELISNEPIIPKGRSPEFDSCLFVFIRGFPCPLSSFLFPVFFLL
jgi:hypothetical protein